MADIQGNLWLCTDCTLAAEGYSLHEQGPDAYPDALSKLEGCDITNNSDSESGNGIVDFGTKWCDGCERYIGDTWHRYALWSK